MKSIFTFIWKWPLPILGLLSVVMFISLPLMQGILNIQYAIVSGILDSGEANGDTSRTIVPSPDGTVAASVVEFSHGGDRLLKIVMDEDSAWFDGIIYITPSGVEPTEEEYYILGFHKILSGEEGWKGEITMEWQSDTLLEVTYCKIWIEEFDNGTSVWFDDDNFVDVEIALNRQECEQRDET